MLKLSDLKPLQRKALLAALESPKHQFNRVRGGYVPAVAEGVEAPTFTYRLMRMMERDYLIAFDDPGFPSGAALTKPGRALAEQLRDVMRAKAGAA